MQKFKNKYRVRSAECDMFNQMRLRSLFNILQDCADLHAEKLGFGYSFCIQNQLTWMGTGYHLLIDRLPQRDEDLIVETWPSESLGITAIRDFEIKDGEGNSLIKATSSWALIDLKRKRPVPIQKYLGDLVLTNERALISDFKKIILPEELDLITPALIRQDDIDINQHVNNAVYPSLILDVFDKDFFETCGLNELKIQFKSGAIKENEVAIFSKIEDNKSHHLIASPQKDVEFARVEASWILK